LTQYEHAATSIRTTIALLETAPGKPGRKISPNGHASPALRAALELEQTRIVQHPPNTTKKSVTATKKPRGFHSGRIRAQRARTLKFLAQFSTTEPRQARPPGAAMIQGLGSLVRRGYVTKKGEGYIRTAKPYVITPTTTRPR
jgi:hypothetical protein